MITTQKQLTFEEYLTYDHGTETRYELVKGQLVPMTPPTTLHILIVKFLEYIFDTEIKRQDLPWTSLRDAGLRTHIQSSRIPDLTVLAKPQVKNLLYSTAVFEAPALLVVEIVSPSSVKDDYEVKLREYQAIKVPEYWIIDPLGENLSVSVYQFNTKDYELNMYTQEQVIRSSVFPKLNLTPTEIFKNATFSDDL